MNKPKKCRPSGKAKGFESCGDKMIIFRYGMCQKCFAKWLYGTSAGNEHIKKNTLRAKKEITEEKKQNIKKAKIENKSIAVLIQEARAPFQKLIRIRDHGKMCICCDKPLPFNIGDYDGGHFYSAEANTGLIFHPDNCQGQRTYCNKYLHGNESGYNSGLISRIGITRYNKLTTLKNELKNHKWDRYKLIELKEYYRKELTQVEKGLKDIKDVDLSIGIIN